MSHCGAKGLQKTDAMKHHLAKEKQILFTNDKT
jgi:hypothetical protein